MRDNRGLHPPTDRSSLRCAGVITVITGLAPCQALSPPFDPHVGWPQQEKIGDYYDMVSDSTGVHIAYAATFNGEQDVYYLHLDLAALFSDGFESGTTDAWSTVAPE
jgi:hypothetical protein